MSASPEAPPTGPSLAARLLAEPAAASERRPERRWAHGLGGVVFASVFLLFHVTVLLVFNTPNKGLLKDFHASFLAKTHGDDYLKGTRLTQSWGMFAPNPNRTNVFIRVFVEDQDGQVWDFEQDIWGDERYPYVWYDRRGKVNRNLDGKRNYQRIYGAWVCREWERTHAGEPAKSVSFIKRWTVVPQPREILDQGGWNQWEAPFKQKEQETIVCKTVVQGTLPNVLRARYGLPAIDEETEFRPVADRSWWDKQERERERAEREAEREAARAAARERGAKAASERGSKRGRPDPLEPDEPGDEPELDSPDQ